MMTEVSWFNGPIFFSGGIVTLHIQYIKWRSELDVKSVVEGQTWTVIEMVGVGAILCMQMTLWGVGYSPR